MGLGFAMRKELPIRRVSAGTILVCDGGFTCNKEKATRMVFQDRKIKGRDGLYIRCKDGRHYLDGSLSDDGKRYVGFGLFPRARY